MDHNADRRETPMNAAPIVPQTDTVRTLRGPEAPHTPPAAAQEADQRLHQRRRAAFEAPRRADARQVPHEQLEIDAADLDEQPFQNVGMPAQMDAAHPAGLIEMRVWPFQQLAPLPQQPFPACAANPPPVGIHRVPRRRLALPVPPAAVRLRDVAAHADGRKPDHRLVAVISLVSDNLRDPRRADRLDLLGGRDERVDQGRRVARTRVLHRHAHDGACVQVDRMLGGVRQMRAAVRVQALKVAEQQQPEIAARRQTRPTDPVRVERRALRLHKRIEPRVVEHPIQPFVKRVPSALRQIRRGHPHRRLPRSAAACPHRHARECRTRDRSCRSPERGTFTTG